MTIDIQFDEASHTYHVNGKKAVSVTEALSVLEDWGNIPKELVEKAGRFGKAVHKAVELWFLGKLDMDSMDQHLIPYLDGYRNFVSRYEVQVVAIEQPVASAALMVAGTPDLVCRLNGRSGLSVVDVKSTYAIPPTVGPQTAGYAELYGATHGEKPKTRFCLHLNPNYPDGYRLIPLKEKNDYSLFISSLNVYQFRKKHGLSAL
jgi:hypothetical protein